MVAVTRLAAILAVALLLAVPPAVLADGTGSGDVSADSSLGIPELTDEDMEALMLSSRGGRISLDQVRTALGTGMIVLGQIILGGHQSTDRPVADQEEVRRILRDAYGYTVQSNYTTAAEITDKLVTNQALTMAFIRAYYALQAETAASDMWSETLRYRGDRILEASHFIDDLRIMMYNIMAVILQFSLTWSEDFQDTVTGKADTYGPMEMGWTWGPNNMYASPAVMTLRDYVTPTSASKRVYVSVTDDPLSSSLQGRNSLYVFGQGTGAMMQNMTTGEVYPLTVGDNDLEARGIPSGWYVLSPGYTYAGCFMPSSEADGLSPSAALVLTAGSDHALAVRSGDSYTVTMGGVTHVTSDISMSVRYDGKTRTQKVTGILDAYQKVWDAANRAARSTVDAGHAAWLLFDAIGSSSSMIKPSSILASMQNNTTVSPELTAAYYAMALRTLREAGDKVSPDDFVVSRESSNLHMYGNVYYEGALVYEGAVFTPFVPEATTLAVGHIRPWETTGQLLIYRTGLSGIDEWDGRMTGGRIVEMGKGFSVQLYNIVHNGTEVSSVDLTVDRMAYLGLMDLDYLINPPEIRVESKAGLVRTIMVLIGIILVLAGLIVPGPSNKLIIWGAAAVVLLVGWYAPGWVTWLF